MSAEFVEKGRTLVAAGQHQEAVKVCRLGLLANPTDLAGRLVLGTALLALNRCDEVLAEMRVALEIDGTCAEGLALKGEALLRKGEVDQARDVLSQARHFAPGDRRIEALSAAALSTPPAQGDTAVNVPPFERADDEDEMELSGVDLIPMTPAPDLGAADVHPGFQPEQVISSHAAPIEPGWAPAPPSGPAWSAPPSGELRSTMLGGHQAPVVLPPPIHNRPSGVPQAEPSAPTLAGAALDVFGRPIPRPGAPIPVSEADVEASGDAALDALGSLGEPRRVPTDVAGIEAIANGGESTRPGKTGATPNPQNSLGPPSASARSDMRMIRQGLGLSPDPTAVGVSRRELQAMLPPALPPQPAPPSEAPPPGPEQSGQQRVQKKAKKSAARKRAAAKKKGRSKLPMFVYALLGLVVIAGAVFAGLKVREIRLEQQIHYALADGDKKASTDTYLGYLRGLESFESILKVKPTAEALAARARVGAQLAFELGEELERASAWVDAAATAKVADVALARVYLALARGDVAEAEKLIETVASQFPREVAEIAYLRGALALERADFAAAERELESGLSERRPLPYLRLAQAQLELGRFDSALAAVETALGIVERHPQAMITRARIMVRAGRVAETNATAELAEVIAEGGREISNQTLGVSRAQVGWAAVALAEAELAQGHRDAAKQALERALSSRRPADLRFIDALVAGLLATGEVEKASAEVELIRKSFADRRWTHVSAARLALASGRAGEAVKELEAAGDLSAYPVALTLRGSAFLETSQSDKAIADFDAALAMVKQLRPAILGRARADLVLGEGKAAKRRLESLFDDIDRADPEVAIAYAQAIAESGDLDRARSVLSQLAKRSETAAVFAAIGSVERIAGKTPEAREAYQRALSLSANHADAVIGLAELDIFDAKLDAAEGGLAGISGAAATSALVLAHRAWVATLRGKHDEAKELVESARESGGASALVAREVGRLALRSGDYTTAVTRLEEAAKNRVDLEARLLLLTSALQAVSAGGAAKPSVDDIVAGIEKDFAGIPEVNFAVGLVAVARRQPEVALNALTAARARMSELRRAPMELGRVEHYIGRAHYIAGDLKKAREAFNSAIRRNPFDADSYYFVGQIEFENEKFDAAAQAYGKSVEVDPSGNPRAWFYLGDVSHVLGNDDAAKKALSTYIEKFPNGSDLDAVKRLLSKL